MDAATSVSQHPAARPGWHRDQGDRPGRAGRPVAAATEWPLMIAALAFLAAWTRCRSIWPGIPAQVVELAPVGELGRLGPVRRGLLARLWLANPGATVPRDPPDLLAARNIVPIRRLHG